MTNRWSGCKEAALRNLACKAFITSKGVKGKTNP